MSRKMTILNQLKENYVFAVVRGKSVEEALIISKKCVAGGIKNIELTYTTPNAAQAIRTFVEKNTDVEVVVGAGTVLDSATANEAILAGAQFIVSPHFDAKISVVCNRYAIPYLPGCGSVTEMVTAMESGADVVKLFPGGLFGANFIKDVHGPLPFAEMMPSGGVSIDNIDQWMAAGAWAVGVGGALTQDVATAGYGSVEAIAKRFIDKVNESK
ncbi:bifunctional 2-keto-4-hydroxyglutarate aldolase/2-keto-3-deoxy-6-phosphogluconate aldolase [Enterococcus alcedinis]|uniref:2-dehydro-3-deoxyphosphooctonate aldolase n=1 Tax=Enterococcus alcedinis TaxID=1274384 RepID=A0A917JGA6_9ENTE|nr:bifunctional 2-keto-4-hydroxyglutarate aldolase/2-keto-3-deoxy-6-phosphogluconate aldolase [Enterococcus alcedinis]MBP2101728.1 2-dehydro-3-deoxyphosphogluconate aldolase/(4S)-4-hydroxy-2-oxoglutarate aldolase [Enterococcus alcedinis]GGI65292.1 2-dehydro-3-deoxyphosphooctonate aldolase [Enterococcus alcedinis]